MMKKIISLIVCLLLMINTSISVFAENNVKIQGLRECIDGILWRGSEHLDVKSKIESDYSKSLDDLAKMAQSYPNYVLEKMGLDPNKDMPIDQQIKEEFALDYEKGFVTSATNTHKYLVDYANAGCFSYLLNNNKMLRIPHTVRLGYEEYLLDGNKLEDYEDKKYGLRYIIIDKEVFDYLENINSIETSLLERGETVVKDIELFGLSDLTLLYIKGEYDEYLVKLNEYGDRILTAIEPYVLYKANELISAFDDYSVKNSPYSQVLSELVLAPKPTFSSEAESLQSEGLLKGNEKGLDLLKPLTRAEAVTLLVRALGMESETGNYKTSQFSDIQSDNWASPYAALAKSRGIVNGVSETEFAPNEQVTADQFATFTLRAMGESNFDYTEGVNILINKGIITQENAETMDFFTRGDMAKIIYESREKACFKK